MASVQSVSAVFAAEPVGDSILWSVGSLRCLREHGFVFMKHSSRRNPVEKFSLADLLLSPSVFIQSRFHSSRSFRSTSYAIRCAHALPCLNIYKCRASRGAFTYQEARWCHGYYFSNKCSGFIYAQNMNHISAGENKIWNLPGWFGGLNWTQNVCTKYASYSCRKIHICLVTSWFLWLYIFF